MNISQGSASYSTLIINTRPLGNNAQKKNGFLIFTHPRLCAALNRQNQNVYCGVAGFMRPLPLFIVYPSTNGFLYFL